MTTEPLRGGAGELTVRAALELMVKELKWWAGKHGLGPARLQAALIQGEAALAAKAPQGVPAVQVDAHKFTDAAGRSLQCRFGCKRHTYSACEMEKEYVCNCECHKVWATFDEICQQEAAPRLPVPVPVSDDTIHHGMVPPLAVSKLADEVNQCLQIILTNAGNIKDDRDGPILEECGAIEDAVDRASKATWAALREAAAPKPAPNFLPVTDAERKAYEKETEAATPAPGAERLRETLRLRAEELHVDQNGSGLPLKGYSDCHRHIFETCTSPKCVEVREALAAAPPVTCEGCQTAGRKTTSICAECVREICLEARHASAERVRQLELTLKNLTLHMGAQLNIIIERSNRQKGSARNRTRRYAGTVEEWLRMAREALPPSTGEKPQ